MGDTSNVVAFAESAQEQYNAGNYLAAAIDAFWTIKYCYEGEPYGIGDIYSVANKAEKIYREASKKLSKPVLSKTQYINGCQCLKYLWLYRHKFNEKKVSAETQKKFEVGHIIGELAQQLFPNGKDATPHKGYCERIIDMSRFFLPTFLKQQLMIEKTKSLIDEDVIYEAAFVHDLAYAAVDILVKEGDKRIAYEVKSSTAVSETFIKDCAFQYYVINNNIRLDDFCLVCVNESYIKELDIPLQDLALSNCDVNKLFIKESIIDRVMELQMEVHENVRMFKSILMGNEPSTKQGEHCNIPYECAFSDYCFHQEHPKMYDEFDIW